MMRGSGMRRRGLAVASLRSLGLGLFGLGMLGGCSLSQSEDWYGYYYENVMINGAPATSRPFLSAQSCLSAMHEYTRNASRWAGFACGQGCTQQTNGFLTDCKAVVR